jgi:hypothetical protein
MEDSSQTDASLESETMGMRREGRGWCTVIGVRMVISGVDNGEDEDEEESDGAYGDTVLLCGSDFWYSEDDVVADDKKVLGDEKEFVGDEKESVGDDVNGALCVYRTWFCTPGWKQVNGTSSL